MTSLSSQNNLTLGITGGSSLIEVGDQNYVQGFFDFAKPILFEKNMADAALIIDRLYKKYVRREDAEKTAFLLQVLERQDVEGKFNRILSAVRYCSDSAELNFLGFKDFPNYSYEPVRIVVAEQPWFLLEKKRPLEEYESNEGQPFWLKKS